MAKLLAPMAMNAHELELPPPGEGPVRRIFREGQRRWPHVELGFDVFSSHCGRVLGASDEPYEAADLYLCCACAAANPEALKAFESEALAVAKAAIARVNRDPDFAQDTLQEVWDKLLLGADAKVNQYAGRGPLKAWVRVTATRVALDRARASGRAAARHVQLSEQLATQQVSPEAVLIKARYGPVFEHALQSAVRALSSEQRNVLRMHVAGRCSIDEIGRAYNVHRATAARWLDRARLQIYEFVREELCLRHDKLTASEFKSLATLIGSQLELSLTGFSTHANQT